MKILVTGDFFGEWIGSLRLPCIQILANRKNKVIIFDSSVLPKKFRRFHSRLYINLCYRLLNWQIANRFVLIGKLRDFRYYVLGNWRMNRLLLKTVRDGKFDFVFIMKGEDINYNLFPELNKYSKLWYWFMDPVMTALKIRANKYAALSTWSSATFSEIAQWFRKYGANSYHIPEGYDATTIQSPNSPIKKEFDVIFSGEPDAKRKAYILFLQKNHINAKLVGKGWPNGIIVPLKDLVISYQKSKIVLNFIRGHDTGFSDRVFNALGTGSFLLSEYCPDLARTFKNGVHLDWFKTPEECLEKIRFYLAHEDERERIAKAGHQYNMEHFTWDKKWDTIFNIIKGTKNEKQNNSILMARKI